MREFLSIPTKNLQDSVELSGRERASRDESNTHRRAEEQARNYRLAQDHIIAAALDCLEFVARDRAIGGKWTSYVLGASGLECPIGLEDDYIGGLLAAIRGRFAPSIRR